LRAQRKIASTAVTDRWKPVADSPSEPTVARAEIAIVWQVAPRALGVMVLIGLALFAGRALLATPPSSADAGIAAAPAAVQSLPVRTGFAANPPADPPELTAMSYTPEPPVGLSRDGSDAPANAAAQDGTAEAPRFGNDAAAVLPDTPALAPANGAAAGTTSPAATSTSQPGEETFVWPEAAVNCPRTWIDDPGSGATEVADACHEYAALPQGAPSPELEAAAEAEAPGAAGVLSSETASGDASVQPPGGELARLPIARPANPPKALTKAAADRPVRTRRGSSSWPSDPPPNCGSKRARWRYTDRKKGTKVWFCK
jgi:hypothetical protein